MEQLPAATWPTRRGSARTEDVAVRASCEGCLVLHRDATVAFCTEELDGRLCLGYDRRHLAGTMPCRVEPKVVRCEHCQRSLQLMLVFSIPYQPPRPLGNPALVN
ncbi:MAG: hypothetical protein M0Z82_09130 [Actinomycetota bacterium]|nr:hypothetical protein [Actinomycetota bacterium]